MELTRDLGIAVIGGGDQARIVISAAESMGLRVKLVLDLDPGKSNHDVHGCPVVGYTAATLPSLVGDDQAVIIAIGDNTTRMKIATLLNHASWATVIHRSAIVDRRCRIGAGTILCAGSIVNPDASIGNHVIINTAAVVEHDVVVGDYCHIAPNATLCGNVSVGEGAMVGAGSVLLPSRTVGAWAQIGAGAVVTQDVPAGAVAVGVPARFWPS